MDVRKNASTPSVTEKTGFTAVVRQVKATSRDEQYVGHGKSNHCGSFSAARFDRGRLLRYMSVAVLYTLIAISGRALAQSSPDVLKTPDSPATSMSESAAKDNAKIASQQPQSSVESDPHQPELTVVPKKESDSDAANPAAVLRYKMGDTLQIKATGDQAKKLKNAATVWLYFDGVRMPNLTTTPIEDKKGNLLLNFHLVRDSSTDENRKVWDAFFKSKNEYVMKVQLAVAAGNDTPVEVQSTDNSIQFFVEKSGHIGGIIFVILAIFFVSYYWIVKQTKMLCDAGTDCYSLGKSQMAFWGLLVLLAFIGVWLLTRTMERIPSQALVLLGISAATGLGAVVIGNSKNSAIQTEIDELQKEKQSLETAKNKAPADFSPESQSRLTETNDKIAKLEKQQQPCASNGFWRDICDDGNGMCFHRLQAVGWTLVLGVIFVWNVVEVMSMPEFPQTLLTLMGVSQATYLGFKIPEK